MAGGGVTCSAGGLRLCGDAGGDAVRTDASWLVRSLAWAWRALPLLDRSHASKSFWLFDRRPRVEESDADLMWRPALSSARAAALRECTDRATGACPSPGSACAQSGSSNSPESSSATPGECMSNLGIGRMDSSVPAWRCCAVPPLEVMSKMAPGPVSSSAGLIMLERSCATAMEGTIWIGGGESSCSASSQASSRIDMTTCGRLYRGSMSKTALQIT
mmetsp:Transcript_2880/g.8494  ORF Transcript_2880/g.8494 Transcript_2880/m.8494 type:complete len:218 (+) Transcript_2880:399-1052(+)